MSVLRPGEKKLLIVGTIESGEQSAFLRYADTEQAGAYQLFIGDDTKPAAVFAVQSDPDESNLAQEPKSDLEPLLNPTAATPENAAPVTPDQAESSHRKVPGQELWFPLALAALLLALIETGLAHRFSQSK